MDSIPQKRCYKCKELKDRTPDNFGPDKRTADGFRTICKPCRHVEYEEALERNPDMNKEQYQKKRQNFEEVEKQRARISAYMRKFRKSKKDTGLCGKCGIRPAGSDRYCDQCREYFRKWKAENRYRWPDYSKAEHRRLRQQVLEAYGSKCQCCGETHPEFLAIDHVNDDGAAHRKEIGAISIERWLRKNGYPQEGFQLLCHNCNFAKFRYGCCPHKRDS